MEIFLGAELEGQANRYWFELQKEFKVKLKQLEKNDYGEEVVDIGIISIILREEYFEGGGYKERVYFDRKGKSFDVRLRIDYKKFIKAKSEERRNIYINHIIESLYAVEKKVKDKEKIIQLIADAKTILLCNPK